ncbi:MAG: transcriptional repressor [Ruminococcaceae bacterium]|nr:transcriptional repressor [Oscillospiraceae bacterium]
MKKEYNTEQKRRIVGFLCANRDRHFTVEEIAAEVCNGSNLGKSTVYRHISKLLESGEIRRFEVDNSRNFVYQYADVHDGCNTHYHLKCVKCGRFIHMECQQLDLVREHIKEEHGFIIGQNRAVLYGQCSDCVTV